VREVSNTRTNSRDSEATGWSDGDSSIPPTTVTNNPPLVASLLAARRRLKEERDISKATCGRLEKEVEDLRER